MSTYPELRILMVIPSFSPLVGGAEKQVAGLAGFLGEISCKVTILTRLLPNTSKTDVIDGVPVRRLEITKYRIVFLLNIFCFIFKNRKYYDVIHVHTLNSPAIVSAFIGKLVHIPVIVKVTRSGKDCQLSRYFSSKVGRLFFYILSNLVTRFIAITDDVKNELLSIGVNPKKITLIPNGVKLPVRNSLKKTKSGCDFVYVGRLIARKRVDLLIDAFSRANLSNNDRLIIIGSGPEMGDLIKLSTSYRLNSRVEFMGEQSHDKVLRTLLLSDVFVLPSDSEGMSNALLEGMASNNAVIAADILANRTLIENGVNGLLFSTIDDLSKCLYQLSVSRDLRMQMSKSANLSIQKNYSFKSIAKEYCDLYYDLF